MQNSAKLSILLIQVLVLSACGQGMILKSQIAPPSADANIEVLKIDTPVTPENPNLPNSPSAEPTNPPSQDPSTPTTPEPTKPTEPATPPAPPEPTPEPTPIPTSNPNSTYENPLPVPEIQDDQYATLTSSIYYTPEIDVPSKVCEAEKNPPVDIEAVDGKVIITLCRNDFKVCQMEGSCKIKTANDMFSITVVKTVGAKTFFVKGNLKRCAYGQGVDNICLDPFFTIAADMRFYKTGDVIYVKEVRGSVLPDGSLHSGYFIVRDMGDFIRGAHRFDFFTGKYTISNGINTLSRIGLSSSTGKFHYTLIVGDAAKKFRAYRGFAP